MLWVGTVALATGAVAVAGLGFGGTSPERPAGSRIPPGTAPVTRTTLTQTERASGTLGYGPATTVTARTATANTGAGTPGAGAAVTARTLTWLPPPGTIVRPGQPVFRVDERPVVLLAGHFPLYRLLAIGVRGPDVEILERNLNEFGYTGFTVDMTFSASTAAAVRRWQRDAGLVRTGTVDVDQVVVAPGEIRVTEHRATAGAEATGPVLTYTGTTRVVTVRLEVVRQHLVRPGLAATVTLPDGRAVEGTVAAVGSVATVAADGPGAAGAPGAPQSGTATVEVVVTVADQAALGTLDAAPVDLLLVANERRNVLTVPVGALVALAEGGYGVQVVEGTTSRYVAVKTGMFGGGRVEISGEGIAEGLTVGMPA
jgi:peptidoglycan hydrolase-like protein with peptidoglycan-binding domain